ncbi:MAG: hypothetical protein ACI8Q1_000254 [Parvicella sp.]
MFFSLLFISIVKKIKTIKTVSQITSTYGKGLLIDDRNNEARRQSYLIGEKATLNKIAVKPRLSRLKKAAANNRAERVINAVHEAILTDVEKITLSAQRSETRKESRLSENRQKAELLAINAPSFKKRVKRKKRK